MISFIPLSFEWKCENQQKHTQTDASTIKVKWSEETQWYDSYEWWWPNVSNGCVLCALPFYIINHRQYELLI